MAWKSLKQSIIKAFSRLFKDFGICPIATRGGAAFGVRGADLGVPAYESQGGASA
jgi:hypothetical protein